MCFASYSDQVSDAVLDACLAEDPLSKVGKLPQQTLRTSRENWRND